MRYAVTLALLLVAVGARADESRDPDAWLGPTQARSARGICSEPAARYGVLLTPEEDGRPFRGIGSPNRGTEFAVEVGAGALPNVGLAGVGLLSSVRARTVLAHLGGRVCVVTGSRFALPLGSHDDGYRTGNLTWDIGVLYRSASDSFRLQVSIGLALPPAGDLGEGSARAMVLQNGFHSALTAPLAQELSWLPALEWGMRSRVRIQFRSGRADVGAIIGINVNAGYARLRSVLGPREGLVGSAELTAGVEGRYPSGYGFFLGPRAALGFGSLWPTDVLLPLQLNGVARLSFPLLHRAAVPHSATRGHWSTLVEVEVSAGAVFPQLAIDAGESYFRMIASVRLTLDRGILRSRELPSGEIRHP